VYLFRAWPLFENSASLNRFVGVFTVKIDVKKYLAGVQKNESEPVQVLYNGTPLYSRNWEGDAGAVEGSLKLTETDELVIRYKRADGQAAAPAPQPAIHEKAAAPAAPPAKAAARAEPEKRAAAQAAEAPVVEKRRVMAVPAVLPGQDRQMITDSLLAASINPTIGLQRAALAIILLGVALVLSIVLFLLMFRRLRRQRQREKARAAMLRPEPIDAIMIPEMDQSRTGEDTRALPQPSAEGAEILSEISSVERETKELPALKELIAESSRKLTEYGTAANPVLRSHLLRDIHENLSVWVSGELRVLTGQLDQLSESIRLCEKNDGHTAELQMLRYEIARILEEVHGIDQRIAREILIK
jgi:hypothetical protein